MKISFDAHAPYAPPQPFDAQFAAKPPRDPWLRDDHRYSPEEIQELMDAYDGAIAYLDHQLGLLFSELAKRDVLNDTLVIITSDHGEEFGEHGLMDHGNNLYLPALHVPLLISFPPHVPAGKRVHEAVTLRNLPVTITDLIELNDKAPFPGSSLIHYWSGTHGHDGAASDPLLSEVNFAPNLPEWFPVSKGNMKSLVTDRYHYIRNGDGREELYDIENDPLEQQDTAYGADDHRMLAWLRAFIERILGLHRSPNS
jgi:arylsulfatase A-like enzyme